MSDPEVIVRIEGVAGRLTLNRPRALNALTADMCDTINEALLAWLALTGARLKAADGCALGIATHYLPSERVEALKASLISGAEIEHAITAFTTDPGPAPLDEHREKLDQMFGFDTVEEIMAALEAGGGWARAQAAILARKCPTTLKVALRLIREGASRTRFAEEMAVEYRLAVRMTARHDFIDGVRAVLIDKDNDARWRPRDLAGVTDAMLDELFAPLPANEEWTPLA